MANGTGSGRKPGRVSRSGDFDRAYKKGRSRSSRLMVVYAFPRTDGAEAESGTRLGITVGRKVGNAVRRNSVKRAIREAFRSLAPGLPDEFDFVVVARSGAAELVDDGGPAAVADELGTLLAGLVGDPDAAEGDAKPGRKT